MKVRGLAILLLTAFAVPVAPATAATDMPRWSIEVKGGRFEPDIEGYRELYGSDASTHFAFGVTWLVRHWLEIGGELGYMEDDGAGVLPSTGEPGAPVEYTLVPAHAYVNLRGDIVPQQLIVPYAGAGATMVYYEQRIDQQPGRSGRTDLGANARVGLQLLLNRVDPVTARESQFLRRSYLFIEAQWFTAEVDGIDLGGVAYLLGFKLEF